MNRELISIFKRSLRRYMEWGVYGPGVGDGTGKVNGSARTRRTERPASTPTWNIAGDVTFASRGAGIPGSHSPSASEVRTYLLSIPGLNNHRRPSNLLFRSTERSRERRGSRGGQEGAPQYEGRGRAVTDSLRPGAGAVQRQSGAAVATAAVKSATAVSIRGSSTPPPDLSSERTPPLPRPNRP